MEITGKYALSLRDLNRFNEAHEIEATAGTAEGAARLAGQAAARGFKVETTGVMRDGQFLWKGHHISGIDGLFLQRRRGRLRSFARNECGNEPRCVTGKAQRHLVSLRVKGALDGRHVTRLFLTPSPLEGPVDLDGEVEVARGHSPRRAG